MSEVPLYAGTVSYERGTPVCRGGGLFLMSEIPLYAGASGKENVLRERCPYTAPYGDPREAGCFL